MPRPTKKSNRAGRPPRASKASTEIVKLRVTGDERARWQQAAQRQGLSLSQWLREAAELAWARGASR